MKNNKTNHYLNSAIYCDNLKIGFGKKKNQKILIDNFAFNFKPSKVYGIIGNSGIGKTTLVNHLNGLYRTISGNIYIKYLQILSNQKRIKNIKKIRKDVGFVFQIPQTQLFKDTIIKDVEFGPRNLSSKEHAHELACMYLRKMRIKENMFDNSPFILSFGQQRRVTIAGCMAIEPSIFIFDEPTAGLDPQGIKLIINLIKELRENDKTIILISHDMNFIFELCDEVILLHDKKILLSGSSYDVFTHPHLTHTHMIKPFIIKVIDSLCKYDKKYKFIYKMQPKTIDELSSILKGLGRKKESE